MDRLIEFLIKKAPYVLAVILGFIAPGNLFLFVWNRSLYVEMDVIKLLILSFGITYIVFIPNTIIFMLLYSIHKKREKEKQMQFTVKFQFVVYSACTMLLTVIELLTYIFYNVCGIQVTLNNLVSYFGIGTAITIVILLFYKFMQWILYKWEENKINNSNQPSND